MRHVVPNCWQLLASYNSFEYHPRMRHVVPNCYPYSVTHQSINLLYISVIIIPWCPIFFTRPKHNFIYLLSVIIIPWWPTDFLKCYPHWYNFIRNSTHSLKIFDDTLFCSKYYSHRKIFGDPSK